MNFWTVPSDFDPDNNSIGCIGGGGAGAGSGCNVQDFGAAGGGGGAYAQANNVPLTPGQTVPYFIGAGGFAYTALAPDVIHNQTRHLGASGGDTFLLSPTLVLAKGGSGGGAWQQRIQLIPPPAIPGGAGGNTGSIGDLIYAGGRGGEVENTIGPGNGNIGTGGGGGAGPLGPGTNGGDSPGGASPPSTTVGGDGDGGGGGIGGTAGDGVGTAAGNGANGTELGTQGAGGGGGGNRSNGNSGVVTAGNAGLYGAGSGGCSVFTFQLAVVGAGSQGAIIVTYDAVAPPPPPVIPPAGFIIERLDNRVWPTVENCWCVDCGFTLARPTPDANLIANSAVGSGIPTGVTDLVGGQGYSSATTAELVDGNGLGPGAGALVNLTIVSGVITAIAFSPAGSGYVFPNLVFNDPENTGSGASATVTLDNSVTFVASAAVFSSGDVGSVIRAGYGVAEITSFVDTQTVIAQMISPIVRVQPDDPINTDQVITQLSGSWTMTEPISSFYLPQLIGFEITGLADGQVIPPTIVPADGIVTLAKPASAIIVGLGFQAQLQSTYLDAGEPTVQGQRKKVAEVTVRIEQSAAFEIGGNQPDGSVQSPQQLAPEWQNMVPAPTHAIAPFNSPATPLFTGDVRVPIPSGFNTRGQVAVQQLNPLPLQVLDYVPEILSGDKPAQEAPQRRGKGDK
jgi:hypothetical protein